ncbi:helix-turn-helix domain-containing protein [Plantactinospora sp. CA-294935]|uniref:helix-turn-helix domain-containing protein n=1 Tax=Plantactinospora sp. CA-294935 TaxID=3240012 RepID=UPI003D8F5E83
MSAARFRLKKVQCVALNPPTRQLPKFVSGGFALREHRGDGDVTAVLAAGLGGREPLVQRAGTDLGRELVSRTRAGRTVSGTPPPIAVCMIRSTHRRTPRDDDESQRNAGLPAVATPTRAPTTAPWFS